MRARVYKYLCSSVKPGECFKQHSVHASYYDYGIKAALELRLVSRGKTREFEYSNTEYWRRRQIGTVQRLPATTGDGTIRRSHEGNTGNRLRLEKPSWRTGSNAG